LVWNNWSQLSPFQHGAPLSGIRLDVAPKNLYNCSYYTLHFESPSGALIRCVKRTEGEIPMKDHFDFGSLAIIALTFVLFVVALFAKGFTHDLLLEAGVFLVSVKLILMAYRNSVTSKELISEIKAIRKIMENSNT
jgi:hypothetical protein